MTTPLPPRSPYDPEAIRRLRESARLLARTTSGPDAGADARALAGIGTAVLSTTDTRPGTARPGTTTPATVIAHPAAFHAGETAYLAGSGRKPRRVRILRRNADGTLLVIGAGITCTVRATQLRATTDGGRA